MSIHQDVMKKKKARISKTFVYLRTQLSPRVLFPPIFWTMGFYSVNSFVLTLVSESATLQRLCGSDRWTKNPRLITRLVTRQSGI